jgi:biopolymer transport protein ExbD
MVDVVFLLIIFFVLVAQISSSERLQMDLPVADETSTVEQPRDNRFVINVIPQPLRAEHAGTYRVGAHTFQSGQRGIDSLIDRLQLALARDPSLKVLIRAARDEPYATVHPVMTAASAAGAPQVHLVTTPEKQ